MNEIVYSTIKRNYTALDIEALEIIAEAYRISQEKKLYTEDELLLYCEKAMKYAGGIGSNTMSGHLRKWNLQVISWWNQQNK